MKIIFFGSSDFAVPSLRILTGSHHELLMVVTRPDKSKGRNLKLMPTPVKEEAQKKGIMVFQPEDISTKESIEYLSSFKPELFVVVSFGQILSKELLRVPKKYCINLHPSLLPKYRGAAPIQWAIMKGEKKTGISVIRMNERMDAGDILLQRTVDIEKEDTALSLSKRLSHLGGLLLLDAIRFVEEDKIKFIKQNEKKASYAPSLKKEDGLINWSKPATDIHNMVRALIPWPGAYTFFNDKILKIWKTDILFTQKKNTSGEIVDIRNDGIYVACSKDILIIQELQLEGKRKMDTASFICGHKIEKGNFFRRDS